MAVVILSDAVGCGEILVTVGGTVMLFGKILMAVETLVAVGEHKCFWRDSLWLSQRKLALVSLQLAECLKEALPSRHLLRYHRDCGRGEGARMLLERYLWL